MRAFWTVVPAVQVNDRWRPDLPAFVSFVAPLDINRLRAGAAPADHTHLIVGNVALMSDNAGGNHEHLVADGTQVLRGTGTAHAHPDPGAPDFYMCFVRCSDAEFATLTGAPYNVKPLVFVDVAGEALGDLDNTPWDNGSPTDYLRRTFWATRCLTLFGLALPAQVDRGKRLWLLLAGLFQARRPGDDRGLRG